MMNATAKEAAIAEWKTLLAAAEAEHGGSLPFHTPAVAARKVYDFPHMPIIPPILQHRERLEDSPLPFSACVARAVGKREVAEVPAAKAAVQKEWDKLMHKHQKEMEEFQKKWSKKQKETEL